MERLKDTYFLTDLDADEFRTLESLTTIRFVKKEETIICQGQPADELFIVRTGSVKVLLSVPEGMDAIDAADQTLVVLGPRECFGEFAFVDRQPSSATVQAAEDSTLFVLRHADLDRTLLADPVSACKIYKALVGVLVSRFRHTDVELALRKAVGY